MSLFQEFILMVYKIYSVEKYAMNAKCKECVIALKTAKCFKFHNLLSLIKEKKGERIIILKILFVNSKVPFLISVMEQNIKCFKFKQNLNQ